MSLLLKVWQVIPQKGELFLIFLVFKDNISTVILLIKFLIYQCEKLAIFKEVALFTQYFYAYQSNYDTSFF